LTHVGAVEWSDKISSTLDLEDREKEVLAGLFGFLSSVAYDEVDDPDVDRRLDEVDESDIFLFLDPAAADAAEREE